MDAIGAHEHLRKLVGEEQADKVIHLAKEDPIMMLSITDPAAGVLAASLLVLRQSIDRYIEHRIQQDKTLEGILKDIQGGISQIAEQDRQYNEITKALDENDHTNTG